MHMDMITNPVITSNHGPNTNFPNWAIVLYFKFNKTTKPTKAKPISMPIRAEVNAKILQRRQMLGFMV